VAGLRAAAQRQGSELAAAQATLSVVKEDYRELQDHNRHRQRQELLQVIG
jgi:hypothetical protein